jgi:hypothetical protein
MLGKLLRRRSRDTGKAQPQQAAALHVSGQMQEPEEGNEVDCAGAPHPASLSLVAPLFGSQHGLEPAHREDAGFQALRRSARAPVAQLSLDRVPSDICLSLRGLEREAQPPGLELEASPSWSTWSMSSPRSALDSDLQEDEVCSPVRVDCWDLRWGAVDARTEGKSHDARSLFEQRVRMHVVGLFSI